MAVGLLLLAGLMLRSAGFTRGASDHVLPENRDRGDTAAFYTFHPDETDHVKAALRPLDLLDPPYTSYGTLSAYTLGVALRATGVRGDLTQLRGATPDQRRQVYYVACGLAVAFSCGVILLVWFLGRRFAGAWGALAAALVAVAVAPGAIQQAHFYIVDGVFAFVSLAALIVILRCCEDRSRVRFLVAGVLIGLAACVRLNGGVLGLLLALGLVMTERGGPVTRLLTVLRSAGLWIAGATAIGLLLLLHPFVFTRPDLMLRDTRVGDFGLAMKFASGEYLQPWTLVDTDVTPYLDHWLELWPLIVGWPLSLGFAAVVGLALWRGGWPERLLAVWCVLYFLPVGALPARAVRHLVPLLAPLSALTVWALRDLYGAVARPWQRRAVLGITGLVGVHLAFLGTAFARIYLEEDARIQAGRFIADAVPRGDRIGIESGAFSVSTALSRNGRLWLDMSRLFYSGPYMLCGDRVDYLHGKARRVQAIAYTDVNRAVQYRAVPDLFPVASSFYDELKAGRLGFEEVRRFKTYPRLAGVVLRDDGVDPSYLGYDHPAVSFLQRSGDVDAAFATWRQAMLGDDSCPDTALHIAARRLRDGHGRGAAVILDSLTARLPQALLSYRLRAAAAALTNDPEAETEAMRRFRPETVQGRMAHVHNLSMVHFVAGSSAHSLVRLGLYDLALRDLRQSVAERPRTARAEAAKARTFLRVAQAFADAGQAQAKEQAVRLSLEVLPTAEAYKALAVILSRRDPVQTREALEASLLLNADQGDVHLALAEVIVATGSDRSLAFYHLNEATLQRPDLTDRADRLRAKLAAAEVP